MYHAIAWHNKNLTALASAIPEIWMGPPKFTRSSAITDGLRDALFYIEISLQP